MTEPKDKIFTRQEFIDAAEKAKVVLSSEAGADLTTHAPHALQKAINEARNAVADAGVSKGQEIAEHLLSHVMARRKAIMEYAAKPDARCGDGSPYIYIVHHNNLYMAAVAFADALGLKELYLAEQKKQKPSGVGIT